MKELNSKSEEARCDWSKVGLRVGPSNTLCVRVCVACAWTAKYLANGV